VKRKRLAVDFVELHILHHASQSLVYGLWMLEELGRHGYRLNASQLYPKFHRLERRGLVKHRKRVVAGKLRKYYRITPRGRTQLAEERRQWQAVDATLRGIWQMLAIAIPAATFLQAA